MSLTFTLEISSSLAQIFLTKSRSVIIPTGCSLSTMITELMCLSVMRRAASVAPRLMSIVTTSLVIILRTGLVIGIPLITKLKSLVSDRQAAKRDNVDDHQNKKGFIRITGSETY